MLATGERAQKKFYSAYFLFFFRKRKARQNESYYKKNFCLIIASRIREGGEERRWKKARVKIFEKAKDIPFNKAVL